MNIVEAAHRQKSIELEKIEISEDDSFLKLKLLAYPIKNQAYPGKTAFVVYYEYETLFGYYSNLDRSSDFQPRFLINQNQNIKSFVKNKTLILKSQSYQEIRLEILQKAIIDSVNQKPLQDSLENIQYFNEHRNEFSKRRIRANDFFPDKKRLEPAA